MWIFLRDGWFSIVRHKDKPGFLLVRSRRRSHLQAVFPDAEVYHIVTADYPWRANIKTETVSEIIKQQTLDIDYTDYKGTIGFKEPKLYNVLQDVWSLLFNWGKEYRG